MNKCNECLAYYNGEHACPEWIKILVKKMREKDEIKFNLKK